MEKDPDQILARHATWSSFTSCSGRYRATPPVLRSTLSQRINKSSGADTNHIFLDEIGLRNRSHSQMITIETLSWWMVWCMRPGKSDDQHVLESLAIGVVAEISAGSSKCTLGGLLCPYGRVAGCVPSRRMMVRPAMWLSMHFPRPLARRHRYVGRVDPVDCDGEALMEVRPLGPFWHGGVVHQACAQGSHCRCFQTNACPGLRPGTIPGQQCRQGLYSWADDYSGGLPSMFCFLDGGAPEAASALHHHGGPAASGETPLCEAVYSLQH